ncbi:MAG: nitrate reductase [Fibrobacteres bacterium]|nr:nitrate reductase [Fibrobacterota bacterium]
MDLKDKFSELMRQRQGRLTHEMVLTPGRFGLGRTPERLQPDSTTSMVCGFCSTGCGLKIHLKDGKAVNLTPDPEYPVNLGMACPKGWEALTPLKADNRATVPMIRGGDGKLAPTDWDTALRLFTDKLKDTIARHGKESIAFLSTGQIPMEELFMLGILAKFGMGLVHGDANTRQCMATAHVAYKQSFGFDAPPFTYKDYEDSDVLVFFGANPCIAHPIMWERVMMNPRKPEIIVVDPRQTETALAATKHYPLLPKSDLPLLYGLAHILIREGWIDRDYIDAHTSGFQAFADHVKTYDPAAVGKLTGLGEARMLEFAQSLRPGKRVSLWWTMGVNQSHEGVRTAQAIINIALMTGNIGKPGTGANSITGQVNAMGSRLFSNTSGLPAGRNFQDADHRKEVADILGIDAAIIQQKPGLAYDQILDGVKEGRIKALWVIATNPAHSWIDQEEFRRAAEKLDLLVVQDMYHDTDTARLAHLVLPSACWGEKEGVVINSERRLGLFKKVSPAPGQALADFYIFKLIAKYWGCDSLLKDMDTPEQTFQVMSKLTVGRPCDISGIRDYKMIDEEGGIQWPYPAATVPAASPTDAAPAYPAASSAAVSSGPVRIDRERRLFEDGRFYHPDGKAKFQFGPPQPIPEPVTPAFPFALLTGRSSSAQWHTNTRTGKSAVLRKLYSADSYVEIHPEDASRLKIASGDWVIVRSLRGRARARASVASTVQPGHLFMPMHDVEVNRLTFPSFDPHSRQPSYKHCAVNVEKEG